MGKIKQLPNWCVTNKFPAIYETDSDTAIEMVAKLYSHTREIVDVLNDFCADAEQTVNSYKDFTVQDMNAFKLAMEQRFQDFTEVLNTKYGYLEYMFQNIENLIRDLNEGKGE